VARWFGTCWSGHLIALSRRTGAAERLAAGDAHHELRQQYARLGSAYGVCTHVYNRRHRTLGHVFQGRYKAILIRKESYLPEVCRYVVLNPVRVKAAERAEQWRWSSYRATAGLGKRLSKFCISEHQASEKTICDLYSEGRGRKNSEHDIKRRYFIGH
jgi:hypothetical protein